MWPFKRRNRKAHLEGESAAYTAEVSESETYPHSVPPTMPWLRALRPQPDTVPWPRLGDESTWRRIFAEGMVPQFVVPQFGFGSIPAPEDHPAAGVEYVPVVALSLAPGQFDFADPETGFQGWGKPHPDRVLRLWADDLLTISHGDRWQMVLNGVEPFDRWWIDSLFPAPGSPCVPPVAGVLVQFTEVGEGLYTHEQLAPLPLSVVHIEDRRTT